MSQVGEFRALPETLKEKSVGGLPPKRARGWENEGNDAMYV